MNHGALERLLRPRSVAVIGASSTPGSLGASVIANLDRMGFGGELHLVNPNRREIGGRACLASVAALPAGLDAAVLAIPRAAVLAAVQTLAEKRTGAAIIFSSGFAESGAEGRAQQQQLAHLAESSGMVLEGPNCLGMVNYVDGIALTFVETPAVALGQREGIGIVSQSGAMACVLGVMLTSRDLGISYSISTGNEAASGVEDYVEYLLEDAHTRVLGMIVELFRRPRRFLALARRARERGKSIVVLHPGRSAASRESAATHTGALAGDYDTMRVLVEREGVLLVDSLEELGDTLELLLRCRVRPDRGTMLITESGAYKALTLDLCEQLGLALPPVGERDAPQLRAAIPEFVPVSNPLDVTAQALADPDLYRRALAALLPDERFGCIVFGIIQTDAVTSDLKFPTILAALEQLHPDKAVIFAGLDEGAVVPAHYIERLRASRVPYFPSPDRAFRAIAKVSALAARDFGRVELAALQLPEPLAGGNVPEYRAKHLLAAAGIAFPQGVLAHTVQQACTAADTLGYPVALKAQSVRLPHKSDAGGVLLGLRSAEAVREGWQRLHANLAQHRPGLILDGVLIEAMGAPGVEMILGGRNDPDWGAVVLVGFGGVHAELLKDVRLLPPDLAPEAIVREIYRLRQAPLLRGFRGAPPLDVQALARLVSTLGALLVSEPRVAEIDLNPVMLYPHGVLALDALLSVRAEESAAVRTGT